MSGSAASGAIDLEHHTGLRQRIGAVKYLLVEQANDTGVKPVKITNNSYCFFSLDHVAK